LSALTSYDAIIVGAGIVGASVAWHASRRGLKVAVLDASGPAAAASGASDGAVSVASKKPGLMATLAGTSLLYCRDLADPGRVLSGRFHSRPSFLFATTDAEVDVLDRLAAMLAQQALPVRILRDSAPEQAAVADLGADLRRVIELSGEGHMLGYEAVHAFLAASGADRLWPCRLDGIEPGDTDVLLRTSRGDLRARQVVIAAGLGSATLVPSLSLTPRSGQLVVTDRATGGQAPDLPGPLTSAAYLLDKSARRQPLQQAPVVIDPLRTGQLLIGSSREDHGTERQADFPTVRKILASAVRCLPALAQRRIIRVFAGVRAASPDGLPIVGPMPEEPNVIVATGFEGDGICLAPLVGREVAAMLAGATATTDLSALAPGRFRTLRRAAV